MRRGTARTERWKERITNRGEPSKRGGSKEKHSQMSANQCADNNQHHRGKRKKIERKKKEAKEKTPGRGDDGF